MKCVICKHGETKPGYGSLVLDHAGKKYFVNNIPADVCATCGEEYFSEDVLADLRESFDDVTSPVSSIETRSYVPTPPGHAAV